MEQVNHRSIASARSSARPPAGPELPGRAAGVGSAPVRAVQRAFQVLAEIAQSPEDLPQSELARRLALPISTVVRLLGTLEGAGFVRRTASGRYAAGAQLVLIGLTAMRGSTLYDLAEPHLRRLSADTGETANLSVRTGRSQWVYLRQVLSTRSIHHASRIGRVLPLEGTAAGAALDGRVGAAGYAIALGTLEPEVAAVAAPIGLPGGAIAGALSVSAPAYRVDEAALAAIGVRVVEAASRLSLELVGASASSGGVRP